MKKFRVLFSGQEYDNIKKDLFKISGELIVSNSVFFRMCIENKFQLNTFGEVIAKNRLCGSVSCFINEDDYIKLPISNKDKAKIIREGINLFKEGEMKKEIIDKHIPYR